MDEEATGYGSRHWRRPHCIRRVPSAPRKGHSTPPPLLGPCLLWPRSPISATAELLLEIDYKPQQVFVISLWQQSWSDGKWVCLYILTSVIISYVLCRVNQRCHFVINYSGSGIAVINTHRKHKPTSHWGNLTIHSAFTSAFTDCQDYTQNKSAWIGA